MQFSDTSNNQGILQEVRFLTSTDSTSYPTNDIVRHVNEWAYRVATWTLEAQDRWQFDDTNLTTHAIATADLVAAQQDYGLPTNLLKLERVEALDSAGNYQRLKHIDGRDVKGSLTEFHETDGMPIYYDLYGGSVFLYPAPAAASVTTTAGLKLWYSREIDIFTSADTTQEPGFPEPFHRIVSYGAAYDWEIVNGTNEKATAFRAEIEAMKTDLQKFFSGRNEDTKVRIIPRHSRNRNNTIV